MIRQDFSVMSGENFKSRLPEDLEERINLFQSKYPNEKSCYDFLYQILDRKNLLDLEQCKCRPVLRKIISKSEIQKQKGGTGKTFARDRKGYNRSSRSKFTGGTGIFKTNPNITHPIPLSLPKHLIEHRDLGVFAECSLCKHKYYITSSTPFHKKSSPLKSILVLFIVAEYYSFSTEHENDIMNACKSSA